MFCLFWCVCVWGGGVHECGREPLMCSTAKWWFDFQTVIKTTKDTAVPLSIPSKYLLCLDRKTWPSNWPHNQTSIVYRKVSGWTTKTQSTTKATSFKQSLVQSQIHRSADAKKFRRRQKHVAKSTVSQFPTIKLFIIATPRPLITTTFCFPGSSSKTPTGRGEREGERQRDRDRERSQNRRADRRGEMKNRSAAIQSGMFIRISQRAPSEAFVSTTNIFALNLLSTLPVFSRVVPVLAGVSL